MADDYSPLTVTRTSSSSNFLYSTSFVLEPQTTPFSQPSNAECTGSVLCSGTPSDGLGCINADSISKTGFDVHNTACYPPEYTNIFSDGGDSDLQSAAYPGDACVADWTTACTATIQGSSGDTSSYPQTYCCPPGGWSCDLGNGRRDCTSSLSTATDIWLAGTDGTYATTAIEGFNNPPMLIYQPVFPLSGHSATGTSSSSGSPGPTDGSSSPSSSDNSSSSMVLSGGAIAGIVIGVTALLALTAGLLFFFVIRPKRQQAASQPPPSSQYPDDPTNTAYDPSSPSAATAMSQQYGQSPPGMMMKPDANGFYYDQYGNPLPQGAAGVGVGGPMKYELGGESSARQELPGAAWQNSTEMPGQTATGTGAGWHAAELGGGRGRPAELPS